MACLAAGCFLTGSAQAASISAGGLSLSPAIENLSLRANQKSASYKITLNNNQNRPVKVSVTSLDFKSLNDTGGLAFIGNTAGQLSHKYGLAGWLDLPKQISLDPYSSQPVVVTIENRPDLSPGGHYAAILFSLSSRSDAKTQVQLNQVVSSLLFVSKMGGETYAVNLSKADFNGNWFRWPSQARLYFKNTGNTQTAPHGIFSLRKSKQILNPDSNLVLPESTRVYQLNLTVKKPFWPWLYRARISYRAGPASPLVSNDVSVVYINPWFLLIPAALIIWFLARHAAARRRIWRTFRRAFRFTKRIFKFTWLFFSVYLPYRYRKYQKSRAAKTTK